MAWCESERRQYLYCAGTPPSGFASVLLTLEAPSTTASHTVPNLRLQALDPTITYTDGDGPVQTTTYRPKMARPYALKMNFLLSLLPFLCSAPLSFAYPAPPQTSPGTCTSLANCLAEAGVETYTDSGLNSWTNIIAPFNLRVPFQPAALVLPKTPVEVSSSLKCAKLYGVKVQARGGGHSYASFGLGGKDGSLVIDMNRFNTVDVDPGTQIAKVGSGVRLGNMATSLYQQGGRALPHGTCPG